MIVNFINSDKKYLLAFEDDIMIDKNFVTKFNEFVDNNPTSDLILLGYLTNTSNLDSFETIWGCQSYCINREYATWFFNEYPFLKETGMDSLITQLGSNRVIIYPPLVIEDGLSVYDHTGQQYFHDSCHKFCMNSNFI